MRYRRSAHWSVFPLLFCSVCLTHDAAAQDGAASPERGRISGRIVLEDGTPARVEGWLQTNRKRTGEEATRLSPESIIHGNFKDQFSIPIAPGAVLLKYFAEGYAPVWLGPLDVGPSQKLDDVKLVLRPGDKALVRVASSDGKPIAGAKILAMPVINNHPSGVILEVSANEKGERRLEHVAECPYFFHVTAPGFEPLTVHSLPLGLEEANELVMAPSLPATGAVFDAEGKAVKGAKILFKGERKAGGEEKGHAGARAFNEVLATTDAAGRFKLDQLDRTSRYVFVVQAIDGSRIVVRTLQAGIEGVEIRLPKDQNLRVKLVGGLGKLPKKNGKPFVSIQQWIQTDWKTGYPLHTASQGGYVKPTDDGGVVDYVGLVSGQVIVTAGDQEVTSSVVENGLTEITIKLGDKK